MNSHFVRLQDIYRIFRMFQRIIASLWILQILFMMLGCLGRIV